MAVVGGSFRVALVTAIFFWSGSGERLRRREHERDGDGTVLTELRRPRVYFLFLAVDKVSNMDVWRNFFDGADKEAFRAYVHCKYDACESSIKGSPLVRVPTVPSYYCTDLVSPMQRLLAIALEKDTGPTNAADQFAFISDSTLPAKPFGHIYNALSTRKGSGFCVFPSNEWADIPMNSHLSYGQLEMVPKAFQWITLERDHAEKAVALWSNGTFHNFMDRFQMNWNHYLGSDNAYADNRNFGCLDEFWHMIAIFGSVQHVDSRVAQMVQLPGLAGPDLQVSAEAGWQGTCDTFVVWSKYLHTPGNNPFHKLYSALDPASLPHGGNSARPGWWDALSTVGINAIRMSDFLFVRKFIDNPRLVDGANFGASYSALVFA